MPSKTFETADDMAAVVALLPTSVRDVCIADISEGPTLTYPEEVASQVEAIGIVPARKAWLRAGAARVRYAHEIAGVDVGGSPVATDRESQGLISGAFALSNANPDLTISFKAKDGTFAMLDASGIQAIAMQVAEHVQACFAKEAELDAAIEAGNVTTMAQIESAFAGIA